MNVNEAKSDLERQIIQWDGVIGIGVINVSGPTIEIAVAKGHSSVQQKIKSLIPNDQWKGFPVKVTPTERFNFH